MQVLWEWMEALSFMEGVNYVCVMKLILSWESIERKLLGARALLEAGQTSQLIVNK